MTPIRLPRGKSNGNSNVAKLSNSDVEVELVLERGRGQASLVDLVALEANPGLDQVVGEHVAGGEEVVVLFQASIASARELGTCLMPACSSGGSS